MAGYSGTPLARKLGIKIGAEVYLVDAPKDYFELLDPLPEGVRFVLDLGERTDVVQLFCTERAKLEQHLLELRGRLAPSGMVWVSWPKRSSGVATDITEDVIRKVALPLGFVDVKVCAIDDIWSGLKLVIRRELR